MSKLTKQDKIHIFEEWTLEDKRSIYLSKKYGINQANIRYLVSLIKIHGLSILDKSFTYYSREFKERAIKRVLLGNKYNVVIKKKGRRAHEQEKAEQIRAVQASSWR